LLSFVSTTHGGGSISHRLAKVLFFQFRKSLQQLGVAGVICKIEKYVLDADPVTADAGLPASLPGSLVMRSNGLFRFIDFSLSQFTTASSVSLQRIYLPTTMI
jgi:hypothetical protein